LIDDAAVLVLFGGEVMTTTGGTPRMTVTVLVSLPKALLQMTVIRFEPTASGTLFVAGVVEFTPLTVHDTGGVPVVEYATLIDVAAVLVLFAGDEIVTIGAVPRFTVIVLLSEPNELVQVTVIVFAPSTNGTVAPVRLDATPFTVQVMLWVPVTL